MFDVVDPRAPQRDRSIMDVPSIEDDDDVGSIIDVPSDDDDDDVGSGKIAPPPPQLPSSSHSRGMMR
jgi:hypothetical protein